MTKSEGAPDLLLDGLDGSNPLGFLATVGVAVVAHEIFPNLRVGWTRTANGWRPVLRNCGEDRREFSETLLRVLKSSPTTVFDIDNRMPFDVAKFARALRHAQSHSSITERRDADLLAGMGTELYPDRKSDLFQDSRLRMVRSGDNAGQGLPFYVKSSLQSMTLDHVERVLFSNWDYQDEGYSLRWDPIGDQRYALRWKDPSKSKLADGPGTMLAANCLAVEALRWFPTLIVGTQTQTTGFRRVARRETYFVWPIWTPMVGVDTLRSLLASPDLDRNPAALVKRGIEEVYRSQRIQQNQYYSNFSPAQPVS